MRVHLVVGLVALALFPGCGGIGKDSKVVLRADAMYYDRADLDAGGPSTRQLALAMSQRSLLISSGAMATVEELDGKYAKVRLLTGRPEDAFMEGATGWVLRDEIAEPTGAQLATYHERIKVRLDAEDAKAAAATARMVESDRVDIEQRMIAGKEFEDKGVKKLAISYYEYVIKTYPKTPEAKVAAERIKAMGAKP